MLMLMLMMMWMNIITSIAVLLLLLQLLIERVGCSRSVTVVGGRVIVTDVRRLCRVS